MCVQGKGEGRGQHEAGKALESSGLLLAACVMKKNAHQVRGQIGSSAYLVDAHEELQGVSVLSTDCARVPPHADGPVNKSMDATLHAAEHLGNLFRQHRYVQILRGAVFEGSQGRGMTSCCPFLRERLRCEARAAKGELEWKSTLLLVSVH